MNTSCVWGKFGDVLFFSRVGVGVHKFDTICLSRKGVGGFRGWNDQTIEQNQTTWLLLIILLVIPKTKL